MPMRPANPLAVALAQSNDIQNGLSNLFAPFSPINTMQAGLLKAQTDLATTKADVERGQLGLANRELQAKLPIYAGQARSYESEASKNNAQRGLYETQTQQIVRQWGAQDQLPQLATAAGLSAPEGNLFGAIVKSSGDSNANNIAGALNAVGRREPIKLDQGQTALLAPADPRNPQVAEPAPSMVPQTQIPFSQGGFGLPSGYQPQGAPMLPQQGGAPAPLGVGPQGNLAGQPSPIQVQGNAITAGQPLKKQLTPAQSAVDESFGKDYAKAVNDGTLADMDKQIQNLNWALGNLQTGKATTGMSGYLPDAVNRRIGNETSVNTRQSVEDSVQRSLRAVLGAQFTENEGKRLIERAYDPTASTEENQRRLSLLINSLNNAYQAKKSAIDYYNKNGTLTGWNGVLPSLGSIEADAGATQKGSPAAGSQGDELVTVVSPSGQTGKIPKANLDAALKRGFKQK